jgi:hypothetical protein
VYIFGGINAQTGAASSAFWAFDLDARSWTHLVTPIGPSARAGSSLVAEGDFLYLFGGQDANNNPNDELWIYSISKRLDFFEILIIVIANNTWTQGPSGPAGRWGHLCWVVDGTMVVSLGYGSDENDGNIYFINENTWYKKVLGDNDAAPSAITGFASFEYGSYATIMWGAGSYVSPAPSLPSIWDRPFIIAANGWIIDEKNPSDYEWARTDCIPGFKFENSACVPEENTECNSCEECEDYHKVRRSYVTAIETKLVTQKYSGFLRQCSAFWKVGIYTEWFASA